MQGGITERAAGAGSPSTAPSATRGSPFRFAAAPPRALAEVAPASILVCVSDAAGAEKVIRHAAAIGSAVGASLALAHVIEPAGAASRPVDPLEWNLRRHRCWDRLTTLAGTSGGGDGWPSLLLEGPAVEQLTRWLSDNSPRMVALSTRSETSAEPGLGRTAEHLLDVAPCSVLLVPPGAPQEPAYRRILVPLDGSCRAESVLPIAIAIARAGNGEILLAHVVLDAEVMEVGPLEQEAVELRQRLARRNEKVAKAYLASIESRLRAARVRTRAAVVQGDPRDALRDLAAMEAVDLVLLSARGHGARTEAACGKVTTCLTRQLEMPMLIVRDREAASAAARATPQPARE